MANVALFRSGQLPQYFASVETSLYVSDADAIINPDISAMSGVPLKYWKRSGNAVLEMTAGEKTTQDAAIAAADLSLRRSLADAIKDEASPEGIQLRALCLILIDEFNILRSQVIGVATSVWDPASMANGTGLTSPNITVTGAQLGDSVHVSCSISLAGVTATAYVSAANTVVIRLHNGTGSAVNLASATYTVRVRRDVVMADRTLAQLKTAYQSKISAGSAD